MTIAFKDFMPTTQRTHMVLTNYEHMYDVLTRANEWIARHHISVLNVETLLLPILPPDTDDITAARIAPDLPGGPTYQAIRVWYQRDARSVETQAYTDATMKLEPPNHDEQGP
jgi:hypothetical protein